MSDIYSQLLKLLQKQISGDDSVIDQISIIADQVCGVKVYRDSLLTSQQVRGVEILLNEWGGMFSFMPGRLEGLPHLVDLLKFIRNNPQIDELKIFERPEWKEIVELRGPVETVQILECGKCKNHYPRMGMSGFLDLIDLYCSQCGNVIFKSLYDDKLAVVCSCGGTAKVGCPNCGSIEGRTLEEMSPYRYFAGHQYKRA